MSQGYSITSFITAGSFEKKEFLLLSRDSREEHVYTRRSQLSRENVIARDTTTRSPLDLLEVARFFVVTKQMFR